jgi:hypothetical protein
MISINFIKNFYFILPKLAVYDDIKINVKNHQIPETRRVDIADGLISEPFNKNK